MADGAAFPPGQQTVNFSELVTETAQAAYSGLQEACNTTPDQTDSEKKLTLLKYLHKTRQRLLRLVVLTKWCRQMPLVERCQQVIGTLSHHDTSFTQAADSLYFLHESLQQARAPLYDIPSASEVLLTGRYTRLPKCIEDLGGQSFLIGDERESTLQKLDTMLRSRLLDVALPMQITSVTVRDGRVIFQVHGEFEAHLTVGYQGNLALWKVLVLKLLVGERSGYTKLNDVQSLALRDDLERRMAGSEDPLKLLYTIMHEFCIALVMDTIFRQIRILRQGRWKDAIRFEAVNDGTSGVQSTVAGQITGQGPRPQADVESELGSSLKTQNSRGLRIWYWLDMGKVDAGLAPSLKIEPGLNQHIVCSHQPTLIDPVTDSEARFHLDHSCIDVEQLLLRAIFCNIHTRLLEIEKFMKSSPQLWRVESDVFVKLYFPSGSADNYLQMRTEEDRGTGFKGEVGEEVLCLRAYGECYMSLGLGVRNGRFLVQSGSNLLRPSILTELEEALNHGLLTPVEVFMSLRSKILLQLFASTATSLNLKVYERGAVAVKFPIDGPKIGSDILLMGFPNCADTYFLCLQLDRNFLPLFMLLEARQQSHTGRSSMSPGPSLIHRWMKIEVEDIRVVEDVANLSLLDQGKSQTFVPAQGEMGLGVMKGGLRGHVVGRNGKMNRDLHYLLDRIQALSWTPRSRAYGSLLGIDTAVLEQLSNRYGSSTSNESLDGSSFSFQMDRIGRFANNQRGGWHPSVEDALHGTTSTGVPPSASTRNSRLHSVSSVIMNHQGDQDALQVKSSMSFEDNAVSPTNFEHENITHLKSNNVLPKTSNPFPVENGFPFNSSRLHGTPSRFSSKFLKKSAHNRYFSPVNSSLIGSLAPDSTAGSEWMEVDESSALTDLSPSISSPSMGPASINLPAQGCGSRSSLLMAGDTNKRKRASTDLSVVPSVQGQRLSLGPGISKRRRTAEDGMNISAVDHTSAGVFEGSADFVGQTYTKVILAANEGKAPVASYMAALLQVVRRCKLCIKRARLSSQLEAEGLPYFEEVGHQNFPEQLRFKLPRKITSFRPDKSDSSCWENLLLRLGRLGSDAWQVLVRDSHFKSLWSLQQKSLGNSPGAPEFVMLSEYDSHIKLTQDGLILCYDTVEDDSVKRLVGDLERLVKARAFILGLKGILEGPTDSKAGENRSCSKLSQSGGSSMSSESSEGGEKKWEVLRRAFRVDSVGPLSAAFTFSGSIPGVLVRFFVAWGQANKTCTLHVIPDQLWPHTKDLEDFINGGEVAQLLDNIRLVATPLHALSAAIRPAGMARAGSASAGSGPSATLHAASMKAIALIGSPTNSTAQVPPGFSQPKSLGPQSLVGGAGASGLIGQGVSTPGLGRGSVSGPLPNSLLPTDVAVLLRSPFWVRIVYRKQFSIDMRCSAADQVWLQPAPPPRCGGPAAGGSLPCPQFRPFVMELVAASMNSGEAGSSQILQGGASSSASVSGTGQGLSSGSPSNRASMTGNASRAALPQLPSRIAASGGMLSVQQGRGLAAGATSGSQHGPRGEFNPTTLGMGDDGGYGGAWVPVAALRKVLRNTLRYLGVLWLFAQFPAILREVLGSILSQSEGALQSLDPEQPALRFFIGNYLFAASMQRDKLILQAVNLTRFQQHQQHQQQQPQSTGPDSEYTLAELTEISDFFQRRVASEPYDASRLASFVTMLTLPISVVREFLGLIAWKKESQVIGQGQGMESNQAPKPRIELCMEKRQAQVPGVGQEYGGSLAGMPAIGGRVPRSSITYNNQLRQVDFVLTVHFDANTLPYNISQAGGASWLPQCVALTLRYAFGDIPRVSLIGMDSSHGGRACWARAEDMEKCKEKVGRAVEIAGGGNGQDQGRGRLRAVAESVQITLPTALQQLSKVVTKASSLLTN